MKEVETMAEDKNYFEILNSIDVNDKVETKGKFSYLSWAYAWGELKKRFPDATYTVYESAQGWNYHTDGRTAWVKTGVTVRGIEHVEFLPVMDNNNRALPLDRITSFEVNKTIQRSLTKAVARHGLGLYIYAGEDIPDAPDATSEPQKVTQKKATTPKAKQQAAKPTPAPAAPAPAPAPAPASQQAAQQPQKKAPEDPARVELREFINANDLDAVEIAKVCGLNKFSTSKDFEDALAYARSLCLD